MKIAFQGVAGAYSDLVCKKLFPNAETLPCPAFEDVFAAVTEGVAAYAVTPVENSVAGRVADVHHLLPEAGLHIVQEHFEKITHHLLVIPGTTLEQVRSAFSHVQGVSQCRHYLRRHNITPVVHADTAGAARDVAYWNAPQNAAIASSLAAETYGLEILASDIADAAHNTTRFLVLAKQPKMPSLQADVKTITTLIFTARSVPAALYKALGGFATNGINLTKLESYMQNGDFRVAQFYVDAEGHPESTAMQHALEELHFYSTQVSILGVYPAAAQRHYAAASAV